MKRSSLMLSLLLILLITFHCKDDKGFSSFYFMLITDTHIYTEDPLDVENSRNQTHNNDKLMDFVENVNQNYSNAAFVAITGDLVDYMFSEEISDYQIGQSNPPEQLKLILDQLSIPYYIIMGNHDYCIGYDFEVREHIPTKNKDAVELVWKTLFNIDPYYSFVYKGYRFIFLNSCRGSEWDTICSTDYETTFCYGSFDDPQLNWLEEELSKPENSLLFFHHPLFTDNTNNLWASPDGTFQVVPEDRIYEITNTYKNKIKGIFVGHGHIWAYDTLHGTIPVYETSDLKSDSDNYHVIQINPNNDTIEILPPYEGVHYFHLKP